MFDQIFNRRRALIGALFALAIGLAFIGGANRLSTAHAQSQDYQQDIQGQVIAGSQLRIYVLDWQDKQPWTGSIDGPSGSIPWSPVNVWTSVTFAHFSTGFEGGTYTINPGSPIAPGWHVAGYRTFPDGSLGGCAEPGAAFTDSASVTISDQEPVWGVCIAVERDGAIFGSTLNVTFVGDPPPGSWTGSISGPNAIHYSLADVNDWENSGTVHNLVPGTWNVYPANEPKPGYTVVGYYKFESDDPEPVCPSNHAAYTLGAYSVNVTPGHSHWVVCVRVAPFIPSSSLTLGFLALAPADNAWEGTVTGPSGIAWPWLVLGIHGLNFMGGRHDIVAGTYSVVAGKPVQPGWVVTGYSSYETTQFLQPCPLDPAAYKPSPKPVTFSDQHPNWGICVRVEKSPEPTATPTVPASTPTMVAPPEFTFGWPYVEPTSTASPTVPAKPATPAPTQTPTSTTSATTVPATATDSPPRPVDENAGGSTQNTSSAPLPPNTGTGAARTNTNSLFLALGLLFLGGSGLTLAAHRLPGRPKR